MVNLLADILKWAILGVIAIGFVTCGYSLWRFWEEMKAACAEDHEVV